MLSSNAQMFICSTIHKYLNPENPKFPVTLDRINIPQKIHTMKYFTAMGMNELQLLPAMQVSF